MDVLLNILPHSLWNITFHPHSLYHAEKKSVVRYKALQDEKYELIPLTEYDFFDCK